MPSRETAPVFIVGTARSGTSLLYHMLLSSGYFPLYRTESLVFEVLIPKFGDLGNPENRRKLLNCWLRSQQFRRSGLGARVVEERVMTSARNGGQFLTIVMDEMARAGGFSRWAVWGPTNLLHMPSIKRQIPNALFIHVIRDGRDVACALDRKRFIRSFPFKTSDRLLASALYWMWSTRKGRRYGSELHQDYLEVRFEELVQQPAAALARISAFILQKLDHDEICRAAIGTLRIPNSSFSEELQLGSFSPVGRSARLLSRERLGWLEELTGDLLTELDYPLHCGQRSHRSIRLDFTRFLYFSYLDLKEWLKAATPLGRLVDMNGLYLNKEREAVDAAERVRSPVVPPSDRQAGHGAGVASSSR